MNFLIDANLCPALAEGLRRAGHAHVRDYDLQAASDPVVLARARREERILVSADADFGTALAVAGDLAPVGDPAPGRNRAPGIGPARSAGGEPPGSR